MLFGSFGSFACILAYSFSTNYIYAVITRFFSGLLNGNLGVIKTYLGEVRYVIIGAIFSFCSVD
jgi:hypothetical protein